MSSGSITSPGGATDDVASSAEAALEPSVAQGSAPSSTVTVNPEHQRRSGDSERGELRGLAERYVHRLSAQDEMTEADGSLRPHWRPFVSMMDDIGPAGVGSLWEEARRIIRANGITHNVYGDPDGMGRPWSLDLLPLLLPDSQWSTLEAGLGGGAELLNALLADLHGAATTVTGGILPAEIVYANPRFLRPVHGIVPPQGRWLHLYAADVVRNSDGQFHILADRTQAPSGAGYSLENRIVLTQVMPTVFRQCNVMRLAPFYIMLRKTLASLAPANRENPRVVLLTPGPYNETYFEHAYLARYLGYTLVQGNDLTVRDGRVYLKTLSGLQRVDVILRRVDDDFCDPLELFPQSFLGVPGLLQAVRDGTVAVANAIGTGVVEAPVFMAFMPALARHLLGAELKIPSVPTWWCGAPDSLRYVREHLAELVIKPAFPRARFDPIFGSALSADERDALIARVTACPADFVAQTNVNSFSAPVFSDRQVQSRRIVLRSYLTVDETGGYRALPGGLTRVSASPDSLLVSLQRGGGSKDTWIISDKPVEGATLLGSATQAVELSRGGGDLTSRVADDLFWLGRYVQRTENIVRLARTTFLRLMDVNAPERSAAISLLLGELLGRDLSWQSDTSAELAGALLAEDDPSGLRSGVQRLHGLARVLRDRISYDAWQILQEIQRQVSEFAPVIHPERALEVLDLLNALVKACLAFGGMAADSMTRGYPWRFLDMGVRLERGLAGARLLRALLTSPSDQEPFLLEMLLEIADSSLTYRRRYLTVLDASAVVDLLLADEDNPRSVAFQVCSLQDHLQKLPRDAIHPHRNSALLTATQLRSTLALTNVRDVCVISDRTRSGLKRLTTDILGMLYNLSDLTSQTYFTHARLSGRMLSSSAGA